MNAALKIIDDICVGGKKPNRENILAFEEIAKTMPQIEIPVKHHIHGGMYGREITIPKDTILTGQIYKFDHFDVMISGDVTVSTDTGETKRLSGYNCLKGMSGKKRAGYTHEDTVWITFHPYTGANGDDIQDFITAKTFEELELFNTVTNRADYKSMIDSIQMTEEEVRAQVENTNDITEMPQSYEHVYIAESSLEGKGLFSKDKIVAGSVICPSRINGNRTIAGRYTNHALLCNAEMVFIGEDIGLKALKDIETGEEITVNYRNVINHRNIKGDLLCQE
jgi:hypothetical protein